MTFRDMYFSRRLNINYSLFAFDISVSCVTKVVNPTETFPILFISLLVKLSFFNFNIHKKHEQRDQMRNLDDI